MKAHLIAEIGCNWSTFDEAVHMIIEAKEAGASYVKFQLFNEETIKESSLKDKLKTLILDEEKVKTLKMAADTEKIGFVLTPMYLDAVDIAAKYADFIKIRYKDHDNQPLIDKALQTRKPLFISVDSRPLNAHNPRILYMYCLPSYPPKPEDVTLEFACICEGLSSHFPHTAIDLAYAVRCFHEEFYIEKHVMFAPPTISLDGTHFRQLANNEGQIFKNWIKPIDADVSITFGQLAELRKQLDILSKVRRIIF